MFWKHHWTILLCYSLLFTIQLLLLLKSASQCCPITTDTLTHQCIWIKFISSLWACQWGWAWIFSFLESSVYKVASSMLIFGYWVYLDKLYVACNKPSSLVGSEWNCICLFVIICLLLVLMYFLLLVSSPFHLRLAYFCVLGQWIGLLSSLSFIKSPNKL